ncbi:MAG: SIS domain-containing protein [Maledivibacter sp.]|jgi:tagatose-6-phosphate ketose/aldose isomerase|nr:SIS domain-containing protein [Maledivibacter sp.]
MKSIFGFTDMKLKEINAHITAKEIKQQPRLWRETFEVIKNSRERISGFMDKVLKEKDLRVVLTGAGTSAFVGDSLVPYLNKKIINKVEAIATTDIVSNPENYLYSDIPTLLISYARSGNSPESVATVNLAEDMVDNLYQIFLTCNHEGSLAKKSFKNDKNLLVLMPEDSNDQGFAMTGSFTCMTLASLLMFDIENMEELESSIYSMAKYGERLLDSRFDDIKEIVSQKFDRAIFLGTSTLKGLSRESALKTLELTSGRIMTNWDSSLGFRHGPKSIIDDKTLVFSYLSNDIYTRKYELDFLKEMYFENGDAKVVAISDYKDKEVENIVDFLINIKDNKEDIEDDVYLLFNYVLVAQMFALFKSIDLGISPDNPSPDGIVNRVVKGFTIYPYNK